MVRHLVENVQASIKTITPPPFRVVSVIAQEQP